MRHEVAAYLEDILIAADDVMRFADGMDEKAYLANDLIRSAVERQLMIVGEAMSQLAKISPETAEHISEWREIISFSNVLVHGYRILDDRQVFQIVRQKLPALRQTVAELISNIEQN